LLFVFSQGKAQCAEAFLHEVVGCIDLNQDVVVCAAMEIPDDVVNMH
jgi:hypothetical protein